MKTRCPWVNLKNPEYILYHDTEWGRPIKDDQLLFEMLTLEGAQAGLSWETVLKKRSNYRRCFHQFDIQRVSQMSAKEGKALLNDSGIIRNRLKIESTIKNAKQVLQIQKEFGSFSEYLWRFVDFKPLCSNFQTLDDYPAQTQLSTQISKDMKKRGLGFVGPTIVYAFMQAVGLTQDHSLDCFLHNKSERF